jgi:hypothetical protein
LSKNTQKYPYFYKDGTHDRGGGECSAKGYQQVEGTVPGGGVVEKCIDAVN